MSSPTRIKICGLTGRADALAAREAGADAVGLVFFAKSSRCVSIESAREIAQLMGPFVSVVGLFVDADKDFVRQVLNEVPLHVLQFHGAESPDYCESFRRPYIKALKVRPLEEGGAGAIASTRAHILAQASAYRSAQGILLDTLSSKGEGGTGESFNWQCVPEAPHINWILAGGLNPDNVGEAVQITKPYGVDVSSGVEQTPGAKDPEKIRRFIANAKAVDQINSGK